MLFHKKEHISLTQYLAKFISRTEVVTGLGGNPGQHPAAVNLVSAEKVFEVDIPTTEEFKEKREEVEKEAAQRYLAALFFYRLSNAKSNSLKTDIVNQALQGKDAVPMTYDKVLKLAAG